MSISAITNTAFSGMQASVTRLSASANNVANVATPGYQRLQTQAASLASGGVSTTVVEGGGEVDLADEMVGVMESSIAFKANAAMFETGGDLWDVLMSIKKD